ncbi:MAG: hypothetical protein QOG00_2090 [Pyrinomonadaceae bacterium]|nr:hypothetical protein [Pyrinomonadaceae bacterium]
MLLITDLDNTLYDWVTFHANAFKALAGTLSQLLKVDEEVLLDEFKSVHQSYGDSEQIRAVLDLPSVRQRFDKVPTTTTIKALQQAFDAYENKRKDLLKLYPGVLQTLEQLKTLGVLVVAHTEARTSTAYDRLERLGILPLIHKLYALESTHGGYNDIIYGKHHEPPIDFVQTVPLSERKPNPQLVLDICQREGIDTNDTLYIGDSIIRDISMAKAAGVTAIWARYGTYYENSLWNILVRVTHWTDEDVLRESELKKTLSNVKPDYIVERFGDLLSLIKDKTR